jgi:predicted enzyme related to lactoylglutathione lyase
VPERGTCDSLAELDVAGVALRVGLLSVEYERSDHLSPFARKRSVAVAGEIVHFEVPAADADRASGFWSGLFGWNIGGSAMEGFDYRMFQVSDKLGGAVMPSDKPGSGVIIYYDTADIDASIAKVRELGGTADDKQPVPTHGWFAACKDTEGNPFSLWQGDSNAA